MATKLTDRGTHPGLRSAEIGPSHFLDITLWLREGTSVGGSSFDRLIESGD